VLFSLRDLDGTHLPLLRYIQTQGTSAVAERLAISPHSIKAFLHYHPTFYHLHVHFTHADNIGDGVIVDRAHLLATVIYNLECNPSYYKNATIQYSLKENDPLYVWLNRPLPGHIPPAN
jgi:m7GpppX diphosphatase